MVVNSHYGPSLFARNLSEIAALAAETINKIVGNKPPLLVYRGSSGVAISTAISMFYFNRYGVECGMLYVRKENEESHGNEVESLFNKVTEYVSFFVDDFISSGVTLKKTCFAYEGWVDEVRDKYNADSLPARIRHIIITTGVFGSNGQVQKEERRFRFVFKGEEIVRDFSIYAVPYEWL